MVFNYYLLPIYSHAHDAMDDAVNTAYILQLSKNKEEFNHIMQPIIDVFKPKITITPRINRNLLFSTTPFKKRIHSLFKIICMSYGRDKWGKKYSFAD